MIVFLLLIILSFNTWAQTSITLPSAKSLYIIDGDSTSIQTRLKGIDTPEIKQSCEPTKGKAIDCGLLAKRHLKKLLKTTPGVISIDIVDFDQYSRALVKIKKGKIDIAEQMVLDGYAFSYHNYNTQERYAKVQKLGFWAFHKPPIYPRIWRKTNKKYRKR